MSAWDPSQYLKFTSQRTRPAAELLARIPLDSPSRIVDLGCGPGNSTELLANRWPGASIQGVDNSKPMLAEARKAHPDWDWVESDIAGWTASGPVDLIFSNAALHWLPQHDVLFPSLLNQLPRGGVLAIQMPRNFQAPAHRLIRQAAEEEPWRSLLAGVGGGNPPLEPAGYYAILASHCSAVDIWETDYLQIMASAAAIAEWIKGSALRPYLDCLAEGAQEEFMACYAAALQTAYPPQPDGCVLFPFKRLFLVAQR